MHPLWHLKVAVFYHRLSAVNLPHIFTIRIHIKASFLMTKENYFQISVLTLFQLDETTNPKPYEPRHQKTNILHMQNKDADQLHSDSFTVTTKTAKLISAFVFATGIVQSLYFLKPKFPASNYLLHSSVCLLLFFIQFEVPYKIISIILRQANQ